MAERVIIEGTQLVSEAGTVWECVEVHSPAGAAEVYRFRSTSGAYRTGTAEHFADWLSVAKKPAPGPELPVEGEPGVRVTIEDLVTADLESRVIWDEYMVVVAGNRRVHSVQTYKNGTAVITIKVDQ